MVLISEEKDYVGWSGACGRMTLNARWGFFSEMKNNMGEGRACGRMNLNARWAFFAKRKIILDGAEHVDR